jgi:hypothetical protein
MSDSMVKSFSYTLPGGSSSRLKSAYGTGTIASVGAWIDGSGTSMTSTRRGPR